MPVTAAEFRRLALALPEAIELEHMGHPDFRVGGKIFATLGAPEKGFAMVKLTPEEQALFLAEAPETFAPAAGAWGRGGATLVQLKAAKKTMLKSALLAAWRARAPKKSAPIASPLPRREGQSATARPSHSGRVGRAAKTSRPLPPTPSRRGRGDTFAIHPLTEDRWSDLEDLFGPAGACLGCWCTYWRMPNADWRTLKGAEKRKLFHARVKKGPPPGLIAYEGDTPVGWVQVAPRADTPNFNSSKRLSAPLALSDADDPRAWAITCFFVRPGHRKKGVTGALLASAVAFARANGARRLEACPWDAGAKKPSAAALYVGALPTFAAVGFKEIVRRAPHRPLLRRTFR